MDITYKFSKSVFYKESILKTVYLWQKDFTIVISEDEYNFLLNISQNDICFSIEQFASALEEQQIREMLNNQFGALRDKIYSKAFEKFKE